MFYVSGVDKSNNNILVMDTADGVEESITRSELKRVIKRGIARIYGAYIMENGKLGVYAVDPRHFGYGVSLYRIPDFADNIVIGAKQKGIAKIAMELACAQTRMILRIYNIVGGQRTPVADFAKLDEDLWYLCDNSDKECTSFEVAEQIVGIWHRGETTVDSWVDSSIEY